MPKSRGHERLEIINGLFVHHLESASLNKALFYTEMLKKQAYDMKDTLWIIRSHNAKGFVLLTEGLLNESLEELQKGRLMTSCIISKRDIQLCFEIKTEEKMTLTKPTL